jgi:protein TonB
MIFLGAGLLSASLHIVGASYPQKPNDVQLDGGEVMGEIALGVGFSDLVAGIGTGTAITPDQAKVPLPNESVAAVPETTDQVQAEMLAAAAPPPQTLRAVAPTQMPESTLSNLTATPQKPVARVPEESLKPKPKEHTPTKAPVAKPTPQAPKGNAAINSSKGQSDGITTAHQAEASKSAKTDTAKQVGAKALQTYHASIFRKISRVPNRAAGAKGRARVGISIMASGTIAAVQIVKSSGNAGVDKLALSQVQRAGPFAPTPSGKAMRVVVQFESKG